MKIETIALSLVDSTQLWAKKHIETKPDKIICVTADEQTKGIGRQGRSWYSPKGMNIYATFCFQLLDQNKAPTISLLMCISCAKMLQQYGFSPMIKWPNDLQLSNKKVAGVLTEVVFQKQTIDLFCGIGLNVNLDKKNLLRIDQAATSLKEEKQQVFNCQELLEKLQLQFAQDLKTLMEQGLASFLEYYESLLVWKGTTVCCQLAEKKIIGTIEKITDQGQLQLILPSGKKTIINSGDLKKINPLASSSDEI